MHDLALALGGMTVSELKQRMLLDELYDWESYVEENGPLNPFLRLDHAVARSVRPFLNGNPSMRQLMPWPKEPEPEATVADVMALLKSAKKLVKRNGK